MANRWREGIDETQTLKVYFLFSCVITEWCVIFLRTLIDIKDGKIC